MAEAEATERRGCSVVQWLQASGSENEGGGRFGGGDEAVGVVQRIFVQTYVVCMLTLCCFFCPFWSDGLLNKLFFQSILSCFKCRGRVT